MIEVKKIKLDAKMLVKFAAQNGMSIDQALNATAYQVEGLAKNMAPVDTGNLKNSINKQRIKEKKYIVQDGTEYGIYQELGTDKMAAHPFMIPAMEQARDQIVDAVKKELEKILR